MKRASQPDEEQATHDEAIIQAEPIIVDHPAKPDPKLLDAVFKVIFIKQIKSFHYKIFSTSQ
jgi:hypothetical protein